MGLNNSKTRKTIQNGDGCVRFRNCRHPIPIRGRRKMETGSVPITITKRCRKKLRNYDKEMLAIMHGFYEWAHYLKGNDEITEVLTDHQNLTFFRKPQNINCRQAHCVRKAAAQDIGLSE